MPPTNPRIVVVDNNNGIFSIVRAALELLGRHPRLIETHTADDAIMEIRVLSPDLLVTAQSLMGHTDGPTLAMSAKRELAALPIIVVAHDHDPEIDDETLSQSPFQYLRKPMAPEAFIRALRIALDGPQAVPQETHVTENLMGPVPNVDGDKLRPVLFQLLRDVGAMAAVLADRNGKVSTFEGAAGYIDRDLLAGALGPGFGSVTKLLSVIGDQPRVLQHYDGDKGDIFGLAVGLHYFIMLVFDGNAPASALGNVKRYGGSAVDEMLNVIGAEKAFSMKPVSAAPSPEPAPAPTGKKSRRTQEVPAVMASEPAKNKRASETVDARPKLEAIENFDPSLLDALGSIDLSAADDLFSPERMAASASGDDSKISFEDAMMQGIIGDVEE
jgi:CheY-like chemotaxis protein